MNILDLIVISISFIGLIYYGYKGDMDCVNFCTLMIAIACIADIKKKVINFNKFNKNMNLNKKFDYKTFKFWDVVKEIDWREACDMHHRNEDVNANDIAKRKFNEIKKSFTDKTERFNFGSQVEKAYDGYRNVLVDAVHSYSAKKYGDRYVFPSVSDDGLWDLTAHIVGLGKEVYYKVVNNPALIVNYKDDCVENFGYTFLY